jgi:hypothetical protein
MKWGKLAGERGGFEIHYGYVAYAAMTATQRQFHDAHTRVPHVGPPALEKMRVKMLEMRRTAPTVTRRTTRSRTIRRSSWS